MLSFWPSAPDKVSQRLALGNTGTEAPLEWDSPPSCWRYMIHHTFSVLRSASPSFRLFGSAPFPHSPHSLPIPI